MENQSNKSKEESHTIVTFNPLGEIDEENQLGMEEISGKN